MGNTAWVFPGQGSQEVGMGHALASAYSIVQETFAEADEVLGFSLSGLCFHGPEEVLVRTVNTQPALLTTGVAYARLLQSLGFSPAGAAGHSLGEYAALVVAGAMQFPDALKTVRLRGRLMEEAAPKGTMAAVIGLERNTVRDLCRQVDGVVEPATFNSPGQIVVAGEGPAVAALQDLAEQAGARRVIPLNVSGPFHSSLLKEAGSRLGAWLEDIPVDTPKIPVVSNVTGTFYRDGEDIRAGLARQVSEPVMWEDCVDHMVAAGFDTFVELGPGRVLTGLIRRIAKGMTLVNIHSTDSVTQFVAARGDGQT